MRRFGPIIKFGHTDKNDPSILETIPMKEPIRKSFSQEELVEAGKRWVNKTYGHMKGIDNDRYYEKLGMIYDFVTVVMPTEEQRER